MSDAIWFLKHCDLFEHLTAQQARRLEQRAVVRTFKRGQVIYLPSDPGESVMVLLSGRVKLKHVTPEGKESILAFIQEGELFGELAIVDQQPRSEFAEAVVDCRVCAIPREDMLWLIEQRPQMALGITRLVGMRRRRVENRLRNILFRSNRQRVASLLCELLDSHGRQAADGWEIGLHLSHQEIASLIGATRETVTVALGHLQLDGLIRVKRRQITVLDRRGLTQVAGLGGPAA